MISSRDSIAPLLESDAFVESGSQILALARRFLFEERPIFRPIPAEVHARVRDAALPRHPISPAQLFDELRLIQEYATFGSNHPRWYGGVGGGVNEWGVLAALFAAALNPNCLGGEQAATDVELATVRWLADLVGFPSAEPAGGLLVSGASQATLTALVAARQRLARRLGRDVRLQGAEALPPLVIYASDQTHPAVTQQANVIGVGPPRLIRSSRSTGVIDLDNLQRAIDHDRAHGMLPLCVIGNAGTTNTGSIDPLHALADLCESEQIWMHIDGAYGAFGFVDARIRHLYAGIDRADSLALDPHKWLAAPYECGCLLVKSRQSLLDAFGQPTPPYLRQIERDSPHFSDWGLQLSRGPRALILWVLLRMLGREGVCDLVTRTRNLAALLARELASLPTIRVLAPVTLTTVCFRAEPPEIAGSEEQIRAYNHRLLQHIQHSQQAWPTATDLHGHYALRACVLHPRTRTADIQQFLDVVKDALKEE